MPRFSFDVECNGFIDEHMSTELPDAEAARFYALGLIDIIMHGRDTDPWRVTIKGEGQKLQRVVLSGDDFSGSRHQ